MVKEKIFNINGIDYIVSTDGKIYSTKNIGRGKYHKEIKQRENQDGYLVVTVGSNNNRRVMAVHRIIAMAYVPNPLNLPEVDHIDNDKKNNVVDNLQWITSFGNKSKIPFEKRSESHKWESNGRARLTICEVKEIRRLYESGITKQEIAKRYNCGWSTIHNIILQNTWKNI